jgi:valyl-tRNA synthetase
VTALFEDYDYAAAKAETEAFFWHFADNYLELAKQRLYDEDHPQREGAVVALHHTLLTMLKLFAPILPHVTERIYQSVFAATENESIHTSAWPQAEENWIDPEAESLGDTLIEIATAVRRFKSEQNLSLGTELKRLQLATDDSSLRESLILANADLMSITRAIDIEISASAALASEPLFITNEISIIVEI